MVVPLVNGRSGLLIIGPTLLDQFNIGKLQLVPTTIVQLWISLLLYIYCEILHQARKVVLKLTLKICYKS